MNTISILSWNCRGHNNTIARRNLRLLLMEEEPSILLLQESKCESWDEISPRINLGC